MKHRLLVLFYQIINFVQTNKDNVVLMRKQGICTGVSIRTGVGMDIGGNTDSTRLSPCKRKRCECFCTPTGECEGTLVDGCNGIVYWSVMNYLINLLERSE
jgi:hypothetical protein